ncbi:MAG TPA: hypothetical protein DG048_18555 [Pseudoalteromonas sp.]|nr:hypothetical protein [Pseudoalteromonas sp.]|tara:strand:+ start:401 stop:1216 length:816 start_codon:yes stop_codon:yes gene_type:complete
MTQFQEDDAINADENYRKALRLGDAKEVAATKEFAVNATGNLFVATTLNGGLPGSTQISQEALTAFSQVSVFFAAMTKAMIDENGKSRVYDYDTINKIVSGSGMFVKVTDSDVIFHSRSVGLSFGQDLIETLFGLSGGVKAIAKSLADMIVGVGKEAKNIEITADTQDYQKQVGTIIFVCEYLMGAVSITPIVLSINAKDASDAFSAGPCLKGKHFNQAIRIIKQVYTFVPPEFIKEAAKLNQAMNDDGLKKLVDELRDLIDGEPENPEQD